MTQTRESPIVDGSGQPFLVTADARSTRYESMPAWMQRNWDVGDTDRLNEAHWLRDQEQPINDWLVEKLETVRTRSIYERRNNGTITGMANTLADDVVGADGPSLQVESDDDAYNEALEELVEEWFSAPTFRPNMSAAALLKMWVRNLPCCGEFLCRIDTDNSAAGPVKMRLRPTPVRNLASPADRTGDAKLVLGVEFTTADLDRPLGYWIKRKINGFSTITERWPTELVIHEFIAEEEGQARGVPWLAPTLQASADLRDYDDQVQDAARQMADQSAMLYTENPEQTWNTPETTVVERRTYKMAPPGWKPFIYPATQPPVQYPDYRAERQREIGRPMSMPLLMIRMDASGHNYSSARFDSQGWRTFVAGIQTWLSGSHQSYGTLNRLVDLVAAEGRFAILALRRRPKKVRYTWTWPVRPHVDPSKEESADRTALYTKGLSLTDKLAAKGQTLETHVGKLRREMRLFLKAGLPLPPWMLGLEPGMSATTEEIEKLTEELKATLAEATND